MIQSSITSRSPAAELEAFFRSSALHELKRQFCDIGRRLWERQYVDGNGGNLVVRVGQDLALCTPTLMSKGFLKPEHMCLVDFEGNQVVGTSKRTSEILMHLQIMKQEPRALATCHCHPPHSTAFGIAGMELPRGLVTEFELFVSAALAPYRTPGTPELGQVVAPLVNKHNTIIMVNHGVVSWSHVDIEDAYFKIEIIEAYCRTILIASQLGKHANIIDPAQMQELLKIKAALGIPDPRHTTPITES